MKNRKIDVKNFRITQVVIIGLASLILINSVFAQNIDTPDVSDTEVPDVSDTEVPDVSDTEVPDTPDVSDTEVPDTPDVSDTEVPDTITLQLLTSTMLNRWITSFSATVVNGNVSSTINSVSQLPQIIMAENSNSAINAIVNSQSSILLNTSFPSLTDGTTIINTIGLPNYALPESTSTTAIIPPIVATTNSTSGQTILIPLGKIIPGQEIIASVADYLIPSFGGLKEVALQTSLTATSTGDAVPFEWLTVEVDNKIPSSISSSGLEGTPILFINIQYLFEQSGIGFNWGDPATFAKPPTLTLVVNKQDLNYIQKDAVGCPIVDAYTLNKGFWTSNGLGEISSASISATKCHIKIQTPHFSKFAFSLRHINSIQSSGPGLFSLGSVVTDHSSNWLVASDKINTNKATSIAQIANTKTEYFKTTTEPTEGFGNVVCSKGFGYAMMIGEYTSGNVPYSVIFLKMILLDSAGHVLATGNGFISDIDAQKTKLFNAVARYHHNFDSCAIQINKAIPK